MTLMIGKYIERPDAGGASHDLFCLKFSCRRLRLWRPGSDSSEDEERRPVVKHGAVRGGGALIGRWFTVGSGDGNVVKVRV
jgi:hypothetical protein